MARSVSAGRRLRCCQESTRPVNARGPPQGDDAIWKGRREDWSCPWRSASFSWYSGRRSAPASGPNAWAGPAITHHRSDITNGRTVLALPFRQPGPIREAPLLPPCINPRRRLPRPALSLSLSLSH